MNADDFADAPGSDGTRFSRGFHGPHIAAHEDRDVAIEEVFFANQNDVGRFNHRVGGFDSPDKTAGFYQSQRLVHVSSLLVRRVKYQKACTNGDFFASCITSKAAMLTIYVRSYALHF